MSLKDLDSSVLEDSYDNDQPSMTARLCSTHAGVASPAVQNSTVARHNNAIACRKLAQRDVKILYIGGQSDQTDKLGERRSENCGLHAGLVRVVFGITHWLLTGLLLQKHVKSPLFRRACHQRFTPDARLAALSISQSFSAGFFSIPGMTRY
jgi:hypothetical protein